MKLLQTRGIALRLGAGFALVLLLLLVVAGLGALQIQQLRRQADVLVGRHIAMLDALGRMQEVAADRSILMRDLVLNDSLKVQREVRQKLQVNNEQHARMSDLLSRLADSSGDERARETARRIVALDAQVAATEKTALGLVADGRYDDAKTALADQLTGQHGQLSRLLRESVVSTMADASQSVEESRASHRVMLLVIGGGAALAAVLGASIAFLTARSIIRPVGAARASTLRIASGDLTQPIRSDSRDEIGQLVFALEGMRQALGDAVADIRGAADRVRAGSRHIEEGSSGLAARTEEQAATLEESAASMEEFTATVQQNAQSAGAASALARDTSEVAARGGEAVRGVVVTMQGIHSASTRIGDIIGVIDGIAFQTNILALNAAVEAARAGEQGRGFAVVAGEVRSLAQRSAEAAKEIKKLIEDAAGRVDGGVRQVEAAGRTMDEIVASVGKMNTLTAEIAHASAEQLAGIEQVNRAITQMDRNTQRNAAVVQQAADSARQMAAQAETLVQAVARFKLEAGNGAGRGPVRSQFAQSAVPPEPELLSLPAPLA